MAVVCTLEARQLACVRLGDKQSDELHDLAHVLKRLAVRHSEESLAPGANAAAETESEPPAANPVEVYRCHRRLEGAARERQGNPGGKLYSGCDSRGGRQRHEGWPVDLWREQPFQPRLLVHLRLAGQH